MLQNWASYLLGTVINNDQEGATGSEGVENRSTTRLTSRLTDDDEGDEWVLVDRQDSVGNSDASSVESLDLDEPSVATLTAQLTRTSSMSSIPCTSNMEESWFLTPPPCFTSTGPIHMETSPLENLLIEHPSMSVYQHPQHRRHVALVPSLSDRDDDGLHLDIGLEVEEIQDERGEPVAIVHRVPQRYGVQIIQQQNRQCIKNKNAQKVQIQKASQPLKRAYLERTNKAREVNCRNRRQRRGERSQGANRSFANNNRKC